MEHVPFMCVEDEPRFHEIVNEWIASGEVPEFTAFTKEPTSKRSRRHKKYARESKEAEVLKKERSDENNDLAKQIMKRQENRGKTFDSFLDKLAQKYSNGDDDEEDDLYEEAGKKFASKNAKKKSVGSKDKKETPIKRGRVTKKK
jgi:DnaJ homolog subfamily C member 9